MKIKSIKIQNFKLFDDFEIDFTSNKNESEREIELDFVSYTKNNNYVIPYVNYIVGRNSIGKTTIFEAIKFVANFFTDEHVEAAEKEIFFQKDHKSFQKWMNFKKRHKAFDNENYVEVHAGQYDEIVNKEIIKIYKKEYLKFAKNRKKPIKIKIFFDQKKDFFVELIYPTHSTIENSNSIYNPNFIFKNESDELIQKFKNWAQSTIKFAKINKLFYIEGYYFDDEKTQLNEMLLFLIDEFSKNNKFHLPELNELFKLADPQFEELILSKGGSLRYARKYSKTNLDIETLSSGTKKFIKLLYLILKFAKEKSGILMIDEIENRLHKELVNVIKIGLMEIAAKYDLQVILTTHNPLILKEFVVNKQVISLDEEENDRMIATKVSSLIKPKNSIIKKYENNRISIFPNPEHAKTKSKDIFKKW